MYQYKKRIRGGQNYQIIEKSDHVYKCAFINDVKCLNCEAMHIHFSKRQKMRVDRESFR